MSTEIASIGLCQPIIQISPYLVLFIIYIWIIDGFVCLTSVIRGSQYVAKEYKKATENMQRSYSKKAFSWDNACMETFYNTKRTHSHCDYMSSGEFERVYERIHMKVEFLVS